MSHLEAKMHQIRFLRLSDYVIDGV